MIYVYEVDATTREHKWLGERPCPGHYPGPGKIWVESDADGWIPHDGGECPLPDGVKCDVKFNDGAVASSVTEGDEGIDSVGDEFMITFRPGSADINPIIAYRPILDADTKPEPCRFHDDDAEACETYSGQVPCEPEPPAWDGEGQVEAGMLAKCTRYANPVMVKFVGSKFSVVESNFGDECAMETHLLRPIRSEEDRAIENMFHVINHLPRKSDDNDDARSIARNLYAAMRDGKVPGVKLEER